MGAVNIKNAINGALDKRMRIAIELMNEAREHCDLVAYATAKALIEKLDGMYI